MPSARVLHVWMFDMAAEVYLQGVGWTAEEAKSRALDKFFDLWPSDCENPNGCDDETPCEECECFVEERAALAGEMDRCRIFPWAGAAQRWFHLEIPLPPFESDDPVVGVTARD